MKYSRFLDLFDVEVEGLSSAVSSGARLMPGRERALVITGIRGAVFVRGMRFGIGWCTSLALPRFLSQSRNGGAVLSFSEFDFTWICLINYRLAIFVSANLVAESWRQTFLESLVNLLIVDVDVRAKEELYLQLLPTLPAIMLCLSKNLIPLLYINFSKIFENHERTEILTQDKITCFLFWKLDRNIE